MANTRVLNQKIVQAKMSDKIVTPQTMYELSLPANTLTSGSRLEIDMRLNRIFELGDGCPNIVPDCGVDCTEGIMGDLAVNDTNQSGIIANCLTGGMTHYSSQDLDRDFVTVASGNGKYGFGGYRLCCPATWLPDPSPGDVGTEGYYEYPVSSGIWYDEKHCHTPDCFIQYYGPVSGKPKTGFAFAAVSSTKDDFVGYGVIIDENAGTISQHSWLHQPLTSGGNLITSTTLPSSPVFFWYTSWFPYHRPEQPGDNFSWLYLEHYNAVDGPWYPDLFGASPGLGALWDITGNTDIITTDLGPTGVPEGYRGVLFVVFAIGDGATGVAKYGEASTYCGMCYGPATTTDPTCTMTWEGGV